MVKIIFTIFIIWLTCMPFRATAADKTSLFSEDTAATASLPIKKVVSVYTEFTSAAEKTVLTIPADKHFVLTDMLGMASVEIKEGGATKVKVKLGYGTDKNIRLENYISMQSGIVFSPGTKVVVYPYAFGMGRDSSYGYITLSGYYY